MTDKKLAESLVNVTNAQVMLRLHIIASRDDADEHEAAVMAMRHLTAFKKAIESWIASRACRAA